MRPPGTTLKPNAPQPMDTTSDKREGVPPMRRVIRPALAGLIIAACAIAALVGDGRPGPVAALVLSMIVAAGGFALRKQPAA
jgi:hypothetical protein